MRHYISWLRASWFNAWESILGCLAIISVSIVISGYTSVAINRLEQRVVVLERNAQIDAVPDSVLMENQDYADTGDPRVSLMAVNEAHRSSLWPAAQRAHLKREWWCRKCGTTNKLQVHHICPFHVDPSKELDPFNMITLCMWSNRCHFVIGHLGNFRLYNTNIVTIATNYNPGVVR